MQPCNELGRLGVQDHYIDAFCGRVPKSVLARHYTDYSPERLKEVYDKADLRIFKLEGFELSIDLLGLNSKRSLEKTGTSSRQYTRKRAPVQAEDST